MAHAALQRDIVDWLLALSVPPTALPARQPPQIAPPDSAALLRALVLHCTAPLALRRLDQFPQQRDALEPFLRAAQARNVALAFACVRELAALGEAFGAVGMPWCVLKGVPLAVRHYGDPAARRVGDIDLLVAPDAVHGADAALLRTGCRRAHGDMRESLPPPRYWHEQRYITASGLSLELHHRLHPNPRLLAVPTAVLLARLHRVSLGGSSVPVLEPVTEMLYLCTHGSRHAWLRLLWVCDIAAITTQAPPGFLDAAHIEARRLGVLHPLAEGLLLVETLLGLQAPDWAHALLRRSGRLRYLVKYAEESLWSGRDALGNPVGRGRSSLLAALCQRAGVRFWAWELALRARHEWTQRAARA